MQIATDIPLAQDEFTLLRDLVYRQTGISLRDAKLPLLRSRLIRRIRHHGFGSFAQYYDFLTQQDAHGSELQEMINAVTTNKTAFFRESHHFRMLEELLLAPARQLAAEGRAPALRIWSAGCSSGEEPYSIAITLAANLERLARWDVKVLATDIDTRMVEHGRAGVYSRETIAEVPQELVRNYFLSGTGKYADYVCVQPEIKRLISFARMNLMDSPWPFQGKFDAIFCRNVIIYFDRASQRRLLERYAKMLKPGGLFFAGHSENLFWLGDLFESLGNTVYRVRSAASGALA